MAVLHGVVILDSTIVVWIDQHTWRIIGCLVRYDLIDIVILDFGLPLGVPDQYWLTQTGLTNKAIAYSDVVG